LIFCRLACIAVAYSVYATGVCAQVAAVETSRQDERVDKLELFATGLVGRSALSLDSQGYVYATNYRRAGTIGRFHSRDGAAIVASLPIPASSEASEPNLSGVAIDNDRRFVALDTGLGRVLRWRADDIKPTILVDRFEGRRFDSLFAVAVAQNGNVYFTEPDHGTAESTAGNVFVLDARLNQVVPLSQKVIQPTGCCLSFNQDRLYVADSATLEIHILPTSENLGIETETIKLTPLLTELGADSPEHLGHLAIDKRGWLYVGLWDTGQVAVIDLAGRKPLALIASGGEEIFGLAIYQESLLFSVPGKEAIFRYDLRPLVGRLAP